MQTGISTNGSTPAAGQRGLREVLGTPVAVVLCMFIFASAVSTVFILWLVWFFFAGGGLRWG